MQDKHKTLDLRFKGKLEPDVNILFNELALKVKNSFNELIDYLSKPNMNNIDWWVNELPSRNTYSSPFFHYYCSIHLVNYLTKQPEFDYNLIIVDNKSVKKIIEQIIINQNCNDVNIVSKQKLGIKFNILIKKYFGQTIVFIYNLIKWIIAKKSRKLMNDYLDKKNLILIDTFVIEGYTNSKRWYGKLWNSVNKKIQEKIYFTPTISKVSIWKLPSIYKEIRTNNENYLIKEDHTMLSDLIFAFKYKKRLKSLIIKKARVSTVDITDLVKQCIYNPIEIFSIQESLLTYKFIERVHKQNISVRMSIDWFEGQINDKAWNFAFHKFFSNVNTVAYRCFESYPLYLCSFPISSEVQAGVVPKVFALQGTKSMQSVKEYYPTLRTILIPSYKSDYVWEKRNNRLMQNSKIILIALPISLQAEKSIISKITNLIKTFPSSFSDYDFIFKPHPTKSSIEHYSNYSEDLPKNIIFTQEKSFSLLLKKSKVMITEASSTCLEAISIGVPVILIKRDDGLFYNPLPNGINKILYKICSSLDDLKESLKYYLTMDKMDKKIILDQSQIVRNDYFEPITDKGTKKFLNIN